MTATDPRPGLAAMLAEKLAPAAEALAPLFESMGDDPETRERKAIGPVAMDKT